MTAVTVLKGWLIVINCISFILFMLDKQKAKRNAWRIPEKTLFLSVLCGGGAGALFAMRLFRHKTKKPLFALGVPAVLVMEAVLLLVMLEGR